MSFITRAYGASKLALKAKGPTMMVVAGVASMGAAAVFASKQTLKVEEVLAKHTPDLEKIQEGQSLHLQGYDDKVAAKDRGRVYGRVAYDLTKLYAVPGVLFVGGAALVFGGHHIMLKRNATLAIAFTSVQKAFAAYRARVVENYGNDADQAMMHGWKSREVFDEESGQTALVHERDWETSRQDPYARVFEEGASTQWRPDLGVNKMFVEQTRRIAQQKLNHQGYLYLNDVYEALGFEPTPTGQVVGWKVRYLPDGSRDIPHVDFGLDTPLPDDWKYNREQAIYLDFNCQGLIVGGKIQKLLEQS